MVNDNPFIRSYPAYKTLVVLSCFLVIGFLWSCTQSTGGEKDSIQRLREAVLRQNLFTLRSLIQQYTLDKKKAPQSLNDLVSAGYLKQIPKDSTTGASDWTVDQDDSLSSPNQQRRGINDVHSASRAMGSDGTVYSTW